MLFRKFLYYLDPRKLFKKDGSKTEINLRMMHGINRISIFVFLFALIVLAVKFCGKQ
jgi:hypothetical protein